MSAATRFPMLTMLCVVLMVSSTRAAQFSSSVSGPVLGYVFDAHVGKVRPVRGMLGSATIGAPLEAGFAISKVLPLDSRHGLASTDANPDLLTLTFEGSQFSTVTVSGVPANPTLAAGSLQGATAALYYSDTQEMRIVTGLPQEPHQVAIVRIDEPVSQMAVNNEGTVVVYAVSEGEGEAIYAWSASSGNARFVTSTVSVTGIVINRSGDALVTDRGTNEAFAIWDPAGAAVRRLLANAKDGVSNPVGLALSSNRIYIANTGAVLVLDSGGRVLKHHDCSCAISGIFPFRDSVFRLTDDPGRTTFLLDVSSVDERFLFVPPSQE